MKRVTVLILIVLVALLFRRAGYERLEVASADAANGRIELPTECAELKETVAHFSQGVLTVRVHCAMRNGVLLQSEKRYDSAGKGNLQVPLEEVKAILFTSSDVVVALAEVRWN